MTYSICPHGFPEPGHDCCRAAPGPIEAKADKDLVDYLIARGVLVRVEVCAHDYDLYDSRVPLAGPRLDTETPLYRVAT